MGLELMDFSSFLESEGEFKEIKDLDELLILSCRGIGLKVVSL